MYRSKARICSSSFIITRETNDEVCRTDVLLNISNSSEHTEYQFLSFLNGFYSSLVVFFVVFFGLA